IVNVTVSRLRLLGFLSVAAYSAIVLRLQATGIGAPRAGSWPESEKTCKKKSPGPVHHLNCVGVSPVTEKLAPPAGPEGPVGPVGPVGPLGPLGPVAPVNPIPAGPVAPVGPLGPLGPAGPVAPCGPLGPAWPEDPGSP